MADHNCEGHVRRLLLAVRVIGLEELWDDLGLIVESFEGVGLTAASSDQAVWRTCQRERLVLVTVNRNHRGPDALEAVIRAEGTLADLPVLTFGDADAVLHDRSYALRAAERMMEIVLDIDQHRGAGRLYIP